MRTFTASFLSAASALAVAVSQPASARAETLADAIALAYETNPGIQASRAQLRALNETYVQARSGFGPRVSAQIDLAHQQVDVYQRGRVDSVSGQGAAETFALSQPVFSSGRLTTALNAAEADVLAGRERLRQQESDLLQRVIAAYVGVRRDQQIVRVLRSNVEALRQRLVEVEARVEVGDNTRTDLAQAQSRLAAGQSDAAAAEAVLASTRAAYMAVVGRNPGALDPEPDLPPLPADVDAAFRTAEQANPQILAAKHAEQASRSRVAEARSQNLPNVNLRAQAGRGPNSYASPNPYSNSLQAQVVITQPLFTAGLNSSQIRRASEFNNVDRLNIDATRRVVVQNLSQQWSQVAAARLALSADEATIRASELAFFGMREEERFGLRSTIELLNAQQELSAAQVSYLRNRFTEYTARAAVLAVMGELTVDRVAPGAVPHDAERDFDRVKNKGALPTDFVARVLDSVVAPGLGSPRAATETITPDTQQVLPEAPPLAAAVGPLKTVSEIVDDPTAPTPPPAASAQSR